MAKNSEQTKLHDPSTLGFALGRFFLRMATLYLMVSGLFVVVKYPNDMRGLYLIGLGWATYFITKLLSPRLVPESPKGE